MERPQVQRAGSTELTVVLDVWAEFFKEMKCELRPTRMCFVSTVFFFLFFCFLPLMTLEVGFGPLRIEAISEGGFPSCSVGKEPACQFRRHRRCRFNPWVRKIPWRRKGQPAPVPLPGKCHGQRSLAGYSPKSHKESDVTERLSTRTHLSRIGSKCIRTLNS